MPPTLRVLCATAAVMILTTGSTLAQTPPPPAPYTPPAATAPATPGDAAAPSAAPAAPAPDAPAAAPMAGGAVASDDAIKAVETLLTEIEDVQVVGPWTEGERNGVWRTVMMQVKGKEDVYRFFIQQLERVNGAQTILSTTEIKEVQSVNGAIVGYRADEPTEGETNSLTLFFDIVPSDGEIAETYELHFTKDSPYTFGPATN